MKVVSYSLYGEALRYRVGLLRNLELCQKFYPDWEVVVYCDGPSFDFLNPLVTEKVAHLWVMPDNHWCPPMMWRFLIADDPRVERFCSRDADSRIMQREVDAVNEWIGEDTVLHLMRSHPAHCRKIMGGLFGLTPRRSNWEMPSMAGLIKDFLQHLPDNPHGYGIDELFLAEKIWPWASRSSTQHASVCREPYGAKPFPTKNLDWPRFPGEVFEVDEHWNETPEKNDWKLVPKED